MRTPIRLLALAFAALIGAAPLASAEDRLAEAQRFYDDAMYARALDVLDQVSITQPSANVHQYRALCLIALGRSDAAERAMADIVAADPFFSLDAEAASPRVAAQFAAVRRRLLPPLIRRGFADATARYRDGAMAGAWEQFDGVLRLLDDPALRGDQGLADLSLAASAFAALARAQTPPPPLAVTARSFVAALAPPGIAVVPADLEPAPPAAPSALMVGPAPGPMRVTASAPAAFEPPVAVVRPLPRWTPPDAHAAASTFTGAIAVEVDARGRVVSASTKRVIHPAYDPVVLAAAREWVFQPARQNGRPVRSEVTVEIELLPAGR